MKEQDAMEVKIIPARELVDTYCHEGCLAFSFYEDDGEPFDEQMILLYRGQREKQTSKCS